MAHLTLNQGAGYIKQTGSRSHHTWWPYKAFDVLANCEVMDMNPTIRPNKVLDYYDGVLVFTAEGDDGQQYVGSIIDTIDGIDRYLVKATTPELIKDPGKGQG